jgi:hemerythrin-like domain-containing protein
MQIVFLVLMVSNIMNHTTIISDFMDREHAFLDELWDSVLEEKVDLVKLRELFEVFREYIIWHMKIEDEFIFPKINEHLGLDDQTGLPAMARRDHQGIMKLMELLAEANAEQDPERIELESLNLDKILRAHRAREREIHYAVCDTFIEAEEWQEILGKFGVVSVGKWPRKH